MDIITTFLKKGYDFFSKKSALHIWILFGIGFFYNLNKCNIFIY